MVQMVQMLSTMNAAGTSATVRAREVHTTMHTQH